MYTQISQEQSCTGDNRPAEPVLQRVTVFSLKLKSKPASDPANNVRLFRNDRTRKTEKCFIWETNDWMCCLISFALTTLSETEGSEADTCTLWRWLLLNKGSKNNVIRYSGIYLIKRALIKGVSLSQVKIRLLRSAGRCSRSSAGCSHSQRTAQRKAGLGDIPSTLIWLWFNTHYSGGEVLSLAIQQGCNSPPLLIMIGILKKRRL